MKILVSVDIEGVAGVCHPRQVRRGNAEYDSARRWMIAEANAAIAGAFEGGAAAVLVNDSHGDFRNLIADELDPRAQLVTGKPRVLSMVSGVEQNCDAVFMVGYHARSQAYGVLAHTISSFAFRHVMINGQPFGEAGLYGAVAGEFGTPVALICGDDQFIAETQSLFPGVITAQTKVAHGLTSCTSLAPDASRQLIQQRAAAAIGATPDLKPFNIPGPINCVLEAQTPALADLFAQWPTVQRIDPTTVAFDTKTMVETVRVLNSFSAMSFMLRE